MEAMEAMETSPAHGRHRARLPRLSAREWALLLVLATVQFTHVLDFVIMMPLGPKLQDDLQLSPKDFPAQFSLIVSAYGVSAGICGLLAARVLDRFDRKRSLLVLFVGFAVGTLLCAPGPRLRRSVGGTRGRGWFRGRNGGQRADDCQRRLPRIAPRHRDGRGHVVLLRRQHRRHLCGVGDRRALRLAGALPPSSPFCALRCCSWRGYIPAAPAPHPARRQSCAAAASLEVILHPSHLRA